MAAPLLNNATLYPTITVSMGTPTAASGAIYDTSLYDTGVFGGDTTFVDITTYVRQVSTTRGRSRDTDRFGTGSMTIVLSNKDDRFSPLNLAGPYVSGGITQIRPGVPFKITATWASVEYPIFYGYADAWDDSYVGMGKDGITTVTIVDALSVLANFDGLAVASVGAGELASTRISRIALNAGFTGTMLLDPGVYTMQATTLASNALTEAGLTADSDGGYVFADASGALVFYDQSSPTTRARSASSQFTFGTGVSAVRYEQADPTYDSTLIFNTVSMSIAGGTATTVSDPTSVTRYGTRTYRRYDFICQTDAQAAALAAVFLARYKEPDYLISTLTVQGAANPTVSWPLILNVQLRDRVTVAITAPGGTAISLDCYVDGITYSITTNGWSMTFKFSGVV